LEEAPPTQLCAKNPEKD